MNWDWPVAAGALGLGLALGFILRRGKVTGGAGGGWRGADMSGSLAIALDHLQEAVLIVDGRGRVLAMNAAARSLAESEPATDAKISEVLGDEIAQAVQAGLGGTSRRPLELVRGGDIETYMLSVGSAGDGRQFVVLEDLSDVTSVDRRRRDFVANASHELQTPIAALMGMLELMEDAEEDYLHQLLRRSKKKVEALSLLTGDLIGLARAEDPGVQPSRHPVQIKRVCDGVVERYQDLVQEKGLELITEVPAELEILGDATSLELCVSNLIQNAIAYTDAGTISLRAKALDAGRVRVEVEDTGSGIDPEVLPRIFERFFRGDPARSREAGGSGLGLAIVRNLVGRMGGRVAVSSHPGQGACFQLELPPDPTQPLEGAGQALRR